jgi:hypothetical protein
MEGLKGLKALGVRDLSYRMAYLACSVLPCNRKVTVVLLSFLRLTLCLISCQGLNKNFVNRPYG